MNARNFTIVIACALAAAVSLPGALAKENYVEQGRFEEKAKTEESISNEWESKQRVDEDSAVSAANCQFIVAVEVAIASFASSSALAVVTDEDEVTIAQGGDLFPNNPQDTATAETANSTCSTPIGDVFFDIVVEGSWGGVAAHGSMADAVSALSGGRGGYGSGGPENRIDQGRFETDADLEDNIANEWEGKQEVDSDGNSALSASNCQAVITTRAVVLAIALGKADATIEDSDSVIVTAGDEASTRDIVINQTQSNGNFRELRLENDHTADSSCLQTIASVTILVRPSTPTVPPAS